METEKMKNRTNIFVYVAMVVFLMTTSVMTVRYFDKYGDEVGLAYTGGYAILNCKCKIDQEVELVYNDTSVISKDNCTSQKSVSMRIDITNKTNFGNYGCRVKGDDADDYIVKMKLNYRLCGDEEKECRQPCPNPDPNSFCIVSANGNHSCTNRITECKAQHPSGLSEKHYCPGVLVRSMCDVSGTDKLWSIFVEQSEVCKPGEESANVRFIGKQFYGTPFQINTTTEPIQINCLGMPAYDANTTWTIKRYDGTVVSNGAGKDNGKCQTGFPLPISESIFKSGSQVYKLKVTSTKGAATASLWNLLIVFDGNVNLEEEKTDDGVYTKSVTCQLRPKPSPEFVVNFTWIEDGKEVKTVDGSATAKSTHDIFGTVKEVKCKCLVVYASCKPYREKGPFLQIFDSQPMDVKPAPGATAPQSTVSKSVQSTGASPGQSTEQHNSTMGTAKSESSVKDVMTGTWIAIGVSVAVGVGIAIGVCVFIVIKKGKNRKSISVKAMSVKPISEKKIEPKLNQDILNLLVGKENEASMVRSPGNAHEANFELDERPMYMDTFFNQLRAATRANDNKQDEWAQKFIDEIKEAEKGRFQKTMVRPSWYPFGHKDLKEIAAKLEFKIIPDLYCDPVLVSKSPDQWDHLEYEQFQACYLGNITTLVGIGHDFGPIAKDEPRRGVLYPWWPVNKVDKVWVGKHKAAVDQTGQAKNPKEAFRVRSVQSKYTTVYRIYTIEYSRMDAPLDVRELTIIRIDFWYSIDPDEVIIEHLRAVEMAFHLHELAKSKAKAGEKPVLTVQTWDGRLFSSVFLAAYLSHQLHQHLGPKFQIVDPRGFLKYVGLHHPIVWTQEDKLTKAVYHPSDRSYTNIEFFRQYLALLWIEMGLIKTQMDRSRGVLTQEQIDHRLRNLKGEIRMVITFETSQRLNVEENIPLKSNPAGASTTKSSKEKSAKLSKASSKKKADKSSKARPKEKSAKTSPKEKAAKSSMSSPKEKSAKSSVRIPKSNQTKK